MKPQTGKVGRPTGSEVFAKMSLDSAANHLAIVVIIYPRYVNLEEKLIWAHDFRDLSPRLPCLMSWACGKAHCGRSMW